MNLLQPRKIRNPLLARAAAALLASPLAALAQDAGAGGDDQEVHVQRHVEVVQIDHEGDEGDAPGDGVHKKVRVVLASPDGEGEAKRFVWKGESEDGETFVWRNGEGQVIELDGEPGEDFFFSPGVDRGFLGVELTELTGELRRHFGANEDRGVLIARVVPDSPAQRAGLRVGDVLTHVNGEPVSGSLDVTRRIGAGAAGEVAALEVIRGGKVETLSATLEVRERPQVEIRNLLHRGGDGEPLMYRFNTEGLDEQMEGVRAYFESEEWESAMSEMGDELRQRMEELEVELEGLEQRLEIEIDEEVHQEKHEADGH